MWIFDLDRVFPSGVVLKGSLSFFPVLLGSSEKVDSGIVESGNDV